MTTRKEMTRINDMVRIIQNESKISRVQLVMKMGISISYFDKLRPFLMELFPQQIRYDHDDKLFVFVEMEKVVQT